MDGPTNESGWSGIKLDGSKDSEFVENRGVGMDMDTEIFENRAVDMDVSTEFVENRGVDMDTAWNRCPPNSADKLS